MILSRKRTRRNTLYKRFNQLSRKTLVYAFALVAVVVMGSFFAWQILAATSTSVITTSSIATATGNSTQKPLVRTSNGTLHSFIQQGTISVTCGGQSLSGLLWYMSTDNGANWTCQGQLSSDTTNLEAPHAITDDSDNIYVVYSRSANGTSGFDIHYRKLTKGSDASWTLGTQQNVATGTTTLGYNLAVAAIDSNNRIWVAARAFNSPPGVVYPTVFYSSDLSASPTWTLSKDQLATSTTSTARYIPAIVRFGSKIGIFTKALTGGAIIEWYFRSDSDPLTSWSTPVQVVSAAGTDGATWNVNGDANGNIFIASHDTTNAVKLRYFNGTTWMPEINIGTGAPAVAFASVTTDGHNVWVFYPDATNLNANLSGFRRLVYKKCVPPYTVAACDTSATPVVNYHGTFDKYWSFVSSAYTNDTTDASNTTASDTQLVTSIGDIAYFGKSARFDSVSWSLSTNGIGGVVTWEYWNGSTWSPLTFTSSSNTSFAGSGYGAFTDPADWATTSINSEGTPYYYVRARTTTAFTTTPIGTQMANIPLISSATFLPNPSSNTIYGIWTENALTPFKIRSGSVSVTSTTPNNAASSSIVPKTAAYSDNNNPTYPSQSRKIIRTSDGTIHMFVQAGASTNACSTSSLSTLTSTQGLVWVYSTDFGSTWICGAQLNSDTTNLMRVSAITDSSDNIYITYGQASANPNAGYDVFYRKLTKGIGDNWTIGAVQTAIDSTTAAEGYSLPVIESDGSRLWLIARRYVASNQFQVVAYYSDTYSDAPTWTASNTSLDTGGNSSSSGDSPNVVVFGNKLGVIWRTSAGSQGIVWRYRSNTDGLTTWSTLSQVSTDNVNFEASSAIADSAGNIVFSHLNGSGGLQINSYNGTSWSSPYVLSSSVVGNNSIATDGTNIYVIYLDTSPFSAGTISNRRLVYKRGVAPYGLANFDSSPTNLVSYHGTYDKYWSYVSGSYVDDTTDSADTDGTNTASSGTGSDTQMVSSIGDIFYVGKSEKFDGVNFDIANAGTGGAVVWEYYNGSAWVSINDFVRSSNENLSADGFISFIPNTDWAKTSINGEGSTYYYIRARVVTAYSSSPTAVQLSNIPGPLADPNFMVNTMAGGRLVGMYGDGGSLSVRVRMVSGTADTTAPTTNASSLSMKRSLSGTAMTSNAWTNNTSPYFSWTAGSDDTGGSGLKGYCAYLGTDSSGDPATSKGLLGTSPTSTSGTTCQFIISSTNIDFATSSFRGSTWLSSSNNPYYLNLKAVDSAGNIFNTSTQFQFRFDNTSPTNVPYISCASGSFANIIDMNFSWPTSGLSVSNDSNSGVLGWQYQVNSSSGTWLGTTSDTVLGLSSYIPNSDSSRTLTRAQDEGFITTGVNTIYFRTVDAAGNSSSTASIRSCNISFGGDAANFGGADKVTISPSSSTENTFSLSWPEASPASGRTIKHYYYMINTVPPTSLETLKGNVATYLDNDTSTTVSADSLPNVNKGSNTVYVVAVDDLENYSPSNVISGTFTLNSTDPDNPSDLVASDSSIKSKEKWNVTLTWLAPEYKGAGNLTYVIHRSDDGITFSQVGTTTGLSYVDTAPTSSKYYYKVYSKDGANALSSGTNAVEMTPTGKWTTPPTLTDGPTVSSITTKKATITWSTSRTADSKVAFGKAAGTYNDEEPSNSNQVSAHSITLTGLSPGTTYYYKAKWTDEDGNSDSSEERSFTTAPAPSIKNVAVTNIGLSSVFIQFTSTSANKIKIYYGTSTGFGGIAEVDTSTTESNYSTELSDLSDGTKYYYKINAVDSEGSEYEGTILDFTTFPRPRLSNIRLQEVRGSAQPAMAISWNSNTEVSSIVSYYPEGKPNEARDEVNISLKKGAHSLRINGLFPQTKYILVVKGRDKLGNEAISDSQTFTTSTDTRPPASLNLKVEGSTIPSVGGAAQEVKAQLVISWDTDEPSTSQIEFGEGTGDTYSQKSQRDTNLTTNHLVVISGLTPSKVYHLRALSVDKAGNEGKTIDTVTITPKSTDSALNLVIGNLSEIFGFLLKQ